MQPDSALPFQPNLALWSLLTFGVVLGGIVAVFLGLRRSLSTAQGITKFFVLGAGLLAVIVLVKLLTVVVSVKVGRIHVPLESPRVVSAPPRVIPPSSSNVMPAPVATESESIKPNTELPEWTQQPSQVEGANKFVVVKSGRFATLEEAEQHAFDEAGQAAARHFRNLDPNGVGQCVPMQRELVRELAIRDRFNEISRHDFGTMKNFPMHQIWLRVELNPQFGERFAEPWRQAAVAVRLRMLTGWSIWGTAAAALIAFALRLDAAWNGRRRAAVVGTAVVLALGSLAFLA